MSLRDQLLKAGLASKKDAQRAKRQLKESRKKGQGSKKRKRALEREAKAAEEAQKAAEAEARLTERREREDARDRYEAALRVRNLILGNRLKNRGKHPFYVRGKSGRIHRLEVQPGVATELAKGRIAVALLDHGTREEYVLIGRDAAERIAAIDPSVLVHFVEPASSKDPAEQLLARDWEPSLRPHRVKVTED